MNETKNVIFMEPEEYEAHLKEQERLVKEIEERNEALKREHPEGLAQMTLYDINKNVVNGLPALSGDGVAKAALEFFDWISESNRDTYYMLLCKEMSYYTVFHDIYDGMKGARAEDIWKELNSILSEIGTVKIMEVDTNGAWSIWLDWQNENDCHCFYFFPYGRGIVNV